ncbi:class I SAM-dependent methyltransferase [Halalkalibacter okhensis]|uniref:class I SAM-dependent methyltransferase n=1 Tax=Halalkalibacter okhensis TaxID=333138 RepID=UPI00068B5E6E|nr:class I SAM-dependent methyltransferase [Halalkalibacter okhensis]
MSQYSYVDFLSELEIGSAHPGGFNRTKSIFLNEPIRKEMKVLDVGCGTGDTALFLQGSFHCNVDVIENHPKMLKKVKKRFASKRATINVFEGSVEQMPFLNNTYDYIICESIIAFVDAKKALNECHRVLKNNGILLLNEMSFVEPIKKTELIRCKEFYQLQECNTADQWKEKLEETGFSKINTLKVSSSIESQLIDITLTPNMDSNLLDLLDEHQLLQKELDGKVGNIILKCEK